MAVAARPSLLSEHWCLLAGTFIKSYRLLHPQSGTEIDQTFPDWTKDSCYVLRGDVTSVGNVLRSDLRPLLFVGYRQQQSFTVNCSYTCIKNYKVWPEHVDKTIKPLRLRHPIDMNMSSIFRVYESTRFLSNNLRWTVYTYSHFFAVYNRRESRLIHSVMSQSSFRESECHEMTTDEYTRINFTSMIATHAWFQLQM